MNRHHEMQVFLAVSQTLSLAAAARQLNVSTITATRAVDALEQRLQTPLLERTTRGVKLTVAGTSFATDCGRILQQVNEAEASARGLHSQPRGRLFLSTPLLFGQKILTPILLDYLSEFTEVTIAASYIDRVPNFYEEGIDVAVVAGALPDSALFAVKVGSIRRVVCASPGYLAANGSPVTPEHLLQHAIIHSAADARIPEWRFNVQGEIRQLILQPRVSFSTNQAAINAACIGGGLTRCMSYQVHDLVVAGQLQIVLNTYELPPVPLHLIYREGRKAAARVRSFVDFVAHQLREHPALR